MRHAPRVKDQMPGEQNSSEGRRACRVAGDINQEELYHAMKRKCHTHGRLSMLG